MYHEKQFFSACYEKKEELFNTISVKRFRLQNYSYQNSYICFVYSWEISYQQSDSNYKSCTRFTVTFVFNSLYSSDTLICHSSANHYQVHHCLERCPFSTPPKTNSTVNFQMVYVNAMRS